MAEKRKNTKKVPNLRFPSFEGEWCEYKLGHLSKLITKGTTPNKFVNQGIKFIKIECFAGDIIDMKKCLFIDENTHNKELKRSILEENDLLFAIAGATIGKVNIVMKDILPSNTNQALAIIRLNENENHNFIYQILKSEIMQKYIKDSISVGAQPNLNLEQMNNFSFFRPSLPEQNKIASFLSLIDSRIQTQNKIIEQLETLIKGLREKFLKRKIRFKDKSGNNFPHWKKTTIGNILTIGSGRDYKHLKHGVVPVFGTGGIMTNVDSFLYDGETVCIGRKGTIDKPMYHMGKIWTVDTLFYTHSFINCVPKFVYYIFESINWLQYNEASGVPSLSKNTIEKIEVGTPSFQEQILITNFLSSVDGKIDLEMKIRDQFERLKKYLLANLLI